MAPIFGVLFIAAVALAAPLQDVRLRYEKIMRDIKFAESQFENLPDPKEQMDQMNAYSLLRLSDHLKTNFEEIQHQVLDEMCGAQSECHGSPAFQKGVIKVCLHSDEYVSRQVDLYENFTRCSENLLSDVINQIEMTEIRMDELRYSKQKLMQEYSDSKNRRELEMVLDYHEEIVSEDERGLLRTIKKLHELYESVHNAKGICSAHGYPRISKKWYSNKNVLQCMADFLMNEPESGIVPEDSNDEESQSTEVPENPRQENQESHKKPNESVLKPNQELPKKPSESVLKPNQESPKELNESVLKPNQESQAKPNESVLKPNQESQVKPNESVPELNQKPIVPVKPDESVLKPKEKPIVPVKPDESVLKPNEKPIVSVKPNESVLKPKEKPIVPVKLNESVLESNQKPIVQIVQPAEEVKGVEDPENEGLDEVAEEALEGSQKPKGESFAEAPVKAPVKERFKFHGYPDTRNHDNEDALDDDYFIRE